MPRALEPTLRRGKDAWQKGLSLSGNRQNLAILPQSSHITRPHTTRQRSDRLITQTSSRPLPKHWLGRARDEQCGRQAKDGQFKPMNPDKRREIFSRMQAANPQPTTELEYKSDFQLLIAVLLSAQTTDKAVN